MVTINVRCSNEAKTTVEVELHQTVNDLKEAIFKQLPDYPVSCQKLIFSGRVLKDDDVLSTCKMVSVTVLH
jgi:ubiquilin